MVPNQENMEGDQLIAKPQSCTTAIATTDLCCRSIVLVKLDSLRQFSQAISKMPLVLLFKVLNYFAFIWNETMQLVSGKVELNACQISVLWHNSLVSL